MVDFNNEVTVGRPAVDVERILILQRRNDLIDAMEAYLMVDGSGGTADGSVIRARLNSLFLEIEGMMRRKYAQKKLQKEYTEFQKHLEADEYNDLKKAFNFINHFLDDIRLTRIDTRAHYDRSNIEADNAADGSS